MFVDHLQLSWTSIILSNYIWFGFFLFFFLVFIIKIERYFNIKLFAIRLCPRDTRTCCEPHYFHAANTDIFQLNGSMSFMYVSYCHHIKLIDTAICFSVAVADDDTFLVEHYFCKSPSDLWNRHLKLFIFRVFINGCFAPSLKYNH